MTIADHAVMGQIVLVIVDAHTKWIEAILTGNSCTSATINNLRTLFATFGIPEMLVSDNGTAFTNFEFRELWRKMTFGTSLLHLIMRL